MSFINPDDYDITFSETNIKENPRFLEVESEPILLQTKTENGLLLEVESSASFEIDCRNACEQGVAASGSFTMINSCTLPITVTGMKVSEPVRFSLFQFPDYTGIEVYSSGNVNQLPFTINPREKIKVNTYFHPLYEEIKHGNAGTPENRTGDKFGAEVRMLPGFPIINCNKAPCDASFILTGELLCPNVEHDLEWLENKSNFDQEFNQSSLENYEPPTFQNEFFLRKKHTLQYTNPKQDPSAENYFSGISGALKEYAEYFDQNSWFDVYGDYGISGTLRGVFLHVSGLQKNNVDNTKTNLYNVGFDHVVNINDFTSYRTDFSTEDYEEVNYNGNIYIVLKVKNQPIESIDLMTNQSLFLREINPPGSIEMFLCDEGDFQNEKILES
tara:strand:- start:31 stop:1191 length:1161 start_codon:yes stop_codon:yes gene_type:complete